MFTFFSDPHVGRPTVGTKSFDSASNSILSDGRTGYMTNRSSCFLYNSSLTNSTQFGNDSNYSKFNGENIATNCSRVTVLALNFINKETLWPLSSLENFSSQVTKKNAMSCPLQVAILTAALL